MQLDADRAVMVNQFERSEGIQVPARLRAFRDYYPTAVPRRGSNRDLPGFPRHMMLQTILHCAGTFVLWWPPDHEESTDALFCSCHHAHTALLFQVSSHLSRRRLVTIRIDDPFACISQICTPPAPNIAAHTASSPANVVAVAAAIVRPLCPMVCCITRAYLAEHATMTTRDSNEKSEGGG